MTPAAAIESHAGPDSLNSVAWNLGADAPNLR